MTGTRLRNIKPKSTQLDAILEETNEHDDESQQRKSCCPSLTSFANGYHHLQSAGGFFKRAAIDPLTTYMSAPRFKLPYLQGKAFWGQALHVFEQDGQGIGKVIARAAHYARNDASHMCQLYLGPQQLALFVLHPRDIHHFVIENKNSLLHHDSTGSFNSIFGPNAIFGMAFGTPEYKAERGKFAHFIFSDGSLKKAIMPMQETLSFYCNAINGYDGSIDIKKIANHFAMDMISEKLGLPAIEDHIKDEALQLIDAAAIQLARQTNQLLTKYLPIIHYAPIRYVYQTELDKILEQGNELFIQKVLKPNQHYIQTTPGTWLNPHGKLTLEELYSRATLDKIRQFFVAGSETTATLILFSLLLMADPNNQKYVTAIINEMQALDLTPQQLNFDNLKLLKHLDYFVKEVLRLYPPIPDMVFKLCDKINFAHGQLKAGDVIMISPRFTHTLEAIWGDDAKDFNPERFKDEATYAKLKDSTCFLPFGMEPRPCVGQRFAMQEAMLLIARFAYEYKLRFEEGYELQHPFDARQIFTLRLAQKEVMVNFEKRCVNESEQRMSMGL